jgi:diguanylate cyclase (GGDEF)-like protein
MAKSFMTPGFSTRILLVVLGLFVTGIWGLAWRTASTIQADIEKLLADQMSTAAGYVAADIDAKIQTRLQALQRMATGISPAMMARPEQLKAYLRRADTPDTTPQGYFVLDLQGIVIADQISLPGGIGLSLKDRPFFTAALASQGPVLGEPLLGRFISQPLVSIAIALRDAEGRPTGVLANSLFPADSSLFGQMEKTRLGSTGYFIVISPKSRTVVSSNDPKRILQIVPPGTNRLFDRRIAEGYDGPAIALNSKGLEVFTVSRRLPSAGWILVAGIETREIFAPIANQKNQIFLAALLMSLVMWIVLRFVLRRQIAPLVDASLRMQRMVNQQEPFAPIPKTRNDEVGQLVDSFNQLVLWRSVAEHQMEYLAHHDSLTSLPNRVLIHDRFKQAQGFADRHQNKVGLLFIDLDHFKTINDTLGHSTGDHFLIQIASRLQHCLRDTDTISRQGGDEFLILLPSLTDGDATLPVVEKILEVLQQPLQVDGHELATTASIGISLYPDDGSDFNTVLKHADMAMYQAKEAGRNTYCFFDPRMNQEALETSALRNGLKTALAREELVLYYQPQIDLNSGAVVGAEALIRWQHPERGMIAPAQFIPLAEESGLIVPVGAWVLREACHQIVAWQRAGLPRLSVAVNLSAVQFKRSDMMQTVRSVLEETGCEPSLLELELTETVLLQDTENVLSTVQALKGLGIKLSIDDFGTGYSSLAYLKRLAVDKLKIDQSFVRDLDRNADSAAIVRAIIQMAHSLKLRTVAEGVETAELLQPLRDFACDEVQGYLYARPLPAHAFERYLREQTPLVI